MLPKVACDACKSDWRALTCPAKVGPLVRTARPSSVKSGFGVDRPTLAPQQHREPPITESHPVAADSRSRKRSPNCGSHCPSAIRAVVKQRAADRTR